MYLTSWIITTSKRQKSSEESIILTKKLNNDFIITCESAKWNKSETMYNAHCLKNGSVALSQSIYFCNLRLGTSFNTWYLLPQEQVWNYLAYKTKKSTLNKMKTSQKKKKLSLKALLPLIFPLWIKATPSTYLPNPVSFLTLQRFSLLTLPYLLHSQW